MKEFLAAICKDWITKMSGIASVLLWAASAALAGAAVSIPLQWAFWFAGSLCLVFTAFKVWQAKQAELIALQKKLSDDPTAPAKALALRDFISRGRIFPDWLMKGNAELEASAREMIPDWDARARAFLKTELPAEFELYIKSCPASPIAGPTDMGNDAVVLSFLDKRTAALETILDRFNKILTGGG